MNIELEQISIDEKPVLRNLMQFCFHDYSEFNKEDVGPYGLFNYKYLDHYWTEPGRFAYFVKNILQNLFKKFCNWARKAWYDILTR